MVFQGLSGSNYSEYSKKGMLKQVDSETSPEQVFSADSKRLIAKADIHSFVICTSCQQIPEE